MKQLVPIFALLLWVAIPVAYGQDLPPAETPAPITEETPVPTAVEIPGTQDTPQASSGTTPEAPETPPPLVLPMRDTPEDAVRAKRWGPSPSLPETDIHFFVVSDLGGRFASVQCEETKPPEAHYAHLVKALENERKLLMDKEAWDPILIDAGDMLGPAPLSRHLASSGKEGLSYLKELLARIPFDLRVLGGQELQLGLAEFRTIMRSESTHLRYRAANLECKDPAAPLCQTLSPKTFQEKGYTMVERGGLRIALVPITHIPRNIDTAPYRSLISFTNPTSAARRAVRKAREDAKADLVVLVLHVDDSGDGPRNAIRTARRIRDVDLIFANGIGSASGTYGVQEIRFSDKHLPPIFAAGGRAHEPLSVQLRLVHHEGRFQVSSASTKRLRSPDADVEMGDRLSVLSQEYCQRWGQPLVDPEPIKRIDAESFVEFVLNIMRWQTESEIAVMDRREVALHPWGSIANTFTPDQLLRALPYSYPLRQMTLRGDALASWIQQVFVQMEEENPVGLRFSGISKNASGYQVNGRAIDATRHYSIVTTPFFKLSPTAIKGLPVNAKLDTMEDMEGPNSLDMRTLVERWLVEKRYQEVDTPAGEKGDPSFPSLFDKLLWYTASDLNLAFNQTTVNNPASYDSEPSLTRDELIGLESSGKFRLDTISRFHEWTNVLDITYAATRTGEDKTFSESKDLTFLETAYSWIGLRERTLPGRSWVPVPHAKIRMETELSEDSDRGYHHLEMTGVLGAVWKFSDTISISLGYGLGTELFDPDRSLAHGFDLTFEVKRMPLFEIASSPVFFENRLDIFYKDPGTHDRFRALFSSKLSFSLNTHLALTIGADAFAYTSDSNAPGFSTDFTIGLQGFFANAWQRY